MKHHKTVEQAVINFIEKHNLLSGSKKILIGLSGGSDSVFALHFFNKFKRKYKVEIAAVHVNHSLRGDESDRDEKFCSDLCQNLGVEFYSVKIDVNSFAESFGKSIEEAARTLRYEEIIKTAEVLKADRIVTAHNIDDNTETVLFNLLRGGGLKGLAGIPFKRNSIIRPFLTLSKADITEYLNELNLQFVEDSSNRNIEYSRNYLRKKIIPAIKENFGDSIDRKILQSSEIVRSQFAITDYFINDAVAKVSSTIPQGISLNLRNLQEYPDEIFGEVAKRIVEDKFNLIFTYDIYDNLNNLAGSQVGTVYYINNEIKCVRERGKIVLFVVPSNEKYQASLKIGEEVKLGDKNLSITIVNKIPSKFSGQSSIEYISADKIRGALKIRRWQFGDKIKLLGMTGTKKISDVLTDLKVPSTERKDQYVLEYKKDIVWLIGRRISDKYKITENTKKIIKLCLS